MVDPVILKIVGTAITTSVITGVIGMLAFRIKYAEDMAIRPTFDQTKELIGEVTEALEKIHGEMREDMKVMREDDKERNRTILARIDKHGDKIIKATEQAGKALLIAENMDSDIQRHKKASATRMSKLYKYLKLPDESNDD